MPSPVPDVPVADFVLLPRCKNSPCACHICMENAWAKVGGFLFGLVYLRHDAAR